MLLGTRAAVLALLVAASGALAGVSCGAFGADDPPPASPVGDASEAAPTDAPAEPRDTGVVDASVNDAATGDAAAGNLLSNGDFEIDCAMWGNSDGTLATDPVAHGGNSSCRICGRATLFWFVQQHVVTGIPVGARFVGSMYMRAVPVDAGADAGVPTIVSLEIHDIDKNDQPLPGAGSSTAPPLDDTWKKATVFLDILPEGGTNLAYRVVVKEPGACLLIDDATLVRVK